MGDLHRLDFIIWPAMHDIHGQHDGIGIHQESAERHQGTDTGGETPARIIESIRTEDPSVATDGGMDQGPPTIFSGTGTRERYGGFACKIRTGQVLFKEQHQGQTEMKYEEDAVQVAICQWLDLKRFTYTFTGGGLIHSARTQRTANRLGYRTGVSDLIVWIPNGTVCIEVKKPATYRYSSKLKRLVVDRPAGKQSDEQKAFQETLLRIAGHHYLVATTVSDVQDYFQKIGILH